VGGADPRTQRGNFEGENGPAQHMPGHVWRLIYSKATQQGGTGTIGV